MLKQLKPASAVTYLLKIQSYKFIILFFGFSLQLGVITTFLPEPELAEPMTHNGIMLQILLTVFVVPIIETIIFQLLIIEAIRKIIKRPKNNICLALLLSSTAFALNHTYSLSYFVITFLGGLTLAFAYYLARYRRENAFIMAFLIHSSYNLSTIVYNHLFYN